MIKGGYILQPRKIDDSDIMDSPPHIREIWNYIIRKANFNDNGSIKRGQLFTSYKQIINDLSWNIGYRKESYKKHHCEIAMKVLTKKNMITTTKTTRGLIITICNYEYYQDPKNYECYNETTTKTTRKLHENDTILEERKKEKNVNNDNNINSKKFNFKKSFLELGVEKQIIDDWLIVRKNKKASNTKTAFNKLVEKIKLSGLTANECIRISVEKSWAGFDINWINKSNGQKQKPYTITPGIEGNENRLNFD